MGLFVEVESTDKKCKVIINLDDVIEIAPLLDGGCILYFASTGPYKVKDSYDQFKQFAMETVSADDIAKKVKSLKKSAGTLELDIPKL
jgi:hypothetical protein